ncbi:riboflavin biosynthesis protein RibD [Enterococcus sp. HSIEG1]|nr:riboflavin biosynthesis protein RibD [Enterococcus sp. HSIEG1]
MHETYMKRAISEALKGKGQTFTNPLVGAVIVKDEEIVAVGSHMAYGQPHAEKNAIDSCSSPEKLIDSTIYVTLEPCHHYGKQPPCTTAILQSGIKKW